MKLWLDFIRLRLGQIAGNGLLHARERWRAYEVLDLAALLISSPRRALSSSLALTFGTLLVRIPDPGKWDAGPAWYDRLLRWDSGWYAAILSDGYRYSGDPSVGSSGRLLYPLYPLVSYSVETLFPALTHGWHFCL